MRKIKDSLTAKIFLMITGLLLFVFGITCGLIFTALPAIYCGELEEDLQQGTVELIKELEKYRFWEEAENLLKFFSVNNQANVTLLSRGGKVLFYFEEAFYDGGAQQNDDVIESVFLESVEIGSENNVSEQGDTAKAQRDTVSEEATQVFQYENENPQEEDSVLKIYQVKIGGESYTLLITGTMKSVNQAMEILKRIFPMILAVILLVSILCSAAFSYFLTRPIVKISGISKKMAAMQFREKCENKRTDEVGELAENLNALAANLSTAMEELSLANERLKRDMERERTFFSAASHELKTPLTILKGHLGGMCQNVGSYRNRDYYLRRSYEVTETMEGMVQEILAIARIESGSYETKWEQADLAELARLQIAEEWELLEEKKMNFQADIPEHVNWMADIGMMKKLFRNLLVNASSYSPEKATVGVHMKEQKDCLMFWVENTGIWLPKESLNRIFDAFYRVEDSRNRKLGGSGLGLYIVRTAVQLHGGICGAENYREGVRIWLRLPRRTECDLP